MLCNINFENCQSAIYQLFKMFGVERILAVQCDVTDQDNFKSEWRLIFFLVYFPSSIVYILFKVYL